MDLQGMVKPQIIMGWTGENEENQRSDLFVESYQDASTVIVIPTRGMIPARIVDSLMTIVRPPNAKVTQILITGMEVAHAYNCAVFMILNSSELSKWQYMLTIEEDNLIPPYAMISLQKEMKRGNWDVLGALYWTKGEHGVPQIWGDPNDPEENYRPRTPVKDEVVECVSTGMGCTLWKIDVFRKLSFPWFDSKIDEDEGAWTQDLYFFHKARERGLNLRVGVDCRIKVGHMDVVTGEVW